MKKLYAILLIIAMLAATLVACNDSTSDNSQAQSDTASAAESTASAVSAETSEPEEKCWLPEMKWNKEIICAAGYADGDKTDPHYYEIWCEEDLGDTVSKTVVNRSRWLEDTYGITIEMLWNVEGGAPAYVEKAVNSSLPLDLITGQICYIAPILQNGNFYDLAEENKKYNEGRGWLTLTADYWDQNAVRDYSIANRVYMLTGDILLCDDEATWAMFFNKKMVEELGIEDPYKTVRDGNWTLDTMYNYCREYTRADGAELTWDKQANHTWGMICQSYDAIMFMMGCGQSIIAKDSNDLPVMHISEQRHIDITQKVIGIMIDEDYVGLADFYGSYTDGVYGEGVGIFANGHALFMPQQMSFLNSPGVKSAEFEIGVIPMPKADDIQDGYSSSSNIYQLQMLAVPISNKDNLEATLFALEAMAWYGQRYVKPEYYEKVLKLQKFQDEDAEEMLDLIFNNRTYDMGIAYNWSDMLGFYVGLLGLRSTDVMSHYDSKADAYQAAIDEAIEVFTKE